MPEGWGLLLATSGDNDLAIDIVFLVVEVVFWVPLRLVEIVKRRKPTAEVKQVNAPGLTWRL